MHIDVLTLFPEVFSPFFTTSIVGRAVRANLASIQLTNYRDFTQDKHRTVDDRPFGGGPGMLLMCQPVLAALDAVEAGRVGAPQRVILTPQGTRLNQEIVRSLAACPWLVILCGHYEGFDDRVRSATDAMEISIGDFVTSGGEPAAMALIDAVVRLLPGALGDPASTEEESFNDGLLEYPQYTRPREFRGMKVPDVLLSGDHKRIAAWRAAQRKRRTRERRPDLLERSAWPGDGLPKSLNTTDQFRGEGLDARRSTHSCGGGSFRPTQAVVA